MKVDSALKTIGEVSKQLNIPQHVIRFWETKFSQLKPIQKNNGRRYYSQLEVTTLKQIIDLLYHQKYSIEGAKKKLNSSKNESNQTIINELKEMKKKIYLLLKEND